jgi:cytochrome c biogenesis factor
VKIKELIDYLQTLDPELSVFVKGYEAGFDDVNTISHEELVLNLNNVWYYGKHDLLKNLEKKDRLLNRESEHKSIKGIIIGYEKDFSTR